MYPRKMFTDLDWVGFVAWFSLTFGMGTIISNSMSSGRYARYFRDTRYFLNQPPSLVFSGIWLVLYGLNATAVLLIWRTKGHGRVNDTAAWEISLAFYIAQLVLAGAWSPLIFNHGNVKIALVLLIFATIFALICLVFFFLQLTLSGILFTPYFGWLIVLSYYTIGIALTRVPPAGTGFITTDPEPYYTKGPDPSIVAVDVQASIAKGKEDGLNFVNGCSNTTASGGPM